MWDVVKNEEFYYVLKVFLVSIQFSLTFFLLVSWMILSAFLFYFEHPLGRYSCIRILNASLDSLSAPCLIEAASPCKATIVGSHSKSSSWKSRWGCFSSGCWSGSGRGCIWCGCQSLHSPPLSGHSDPFPHLKGFAAVPIVAFKLLLFFPIIRNQRCLALYDPLDTKILIPFCFFFLPFHSINFTHTHGGFQCKDSLIQTCLKKVGGIIKKQGILSQRGVERLEK